MTEKFDPNKAAEIQANYTKSDAELIDGGARHLIDEKGEIKGLDLTEKQIQEIKEINEGIKFENAFEYVKAKKIILLPRENLPSLLVKPGDAWIGDDNNPWFSFIDKDGNVASVKDSGKFFVRGYGGFLDFNLIKGFNDQTKNPNNLFVNELQQQGFNIKKVFSTFLPPELAEIDSAIYKYKKQLEEEQKLKEEQERLSRFNL
ncbi:MAG: hypothetical protein WC662_03560 [Candidatus Paceibacterota bacterium]|jgi:hypothetical protein